MCIVAQISHRWRLFSDSFAHWMHQTAGFHQRFQRPFNDFAWATEGKWDPRCLWIADPKETLQTQLNWSHLLCPVTNCHPQVLHPRSCVKIPLAHWGKVMFAEQILPPKIQPEIDPWLKGTQNEQFQYTTTRVCLGILIKSY
jgi:hypothetical protein